jgi:NAD(P)-dependent dehydrogenase (short-subunit alcohol dehydrogenase family)
MLPISDSIPRAALVIGGCTPFGDAIAHALTDAGFAVALQFGTGARADAPAGMTMLSADLNDEAQTEALPGRASEKLGPIGVLVNAAFVLRRDTSRAGWDESFAINARAPFVLTQRFAKALPEPREGVVINLLLQRITGHLAYYSASMAASWALTQSMALALAPRIRVNGIAPAASAALVPGDPLPSAGTLREDVARAAMAILALPSMTGQMIIPNGVPR